MDWGRAKTILIVTFLFLNVMLGYELWRNSDRLGGLRIETGTTVEEIKQLLTANSVKLEADLPKDVPKLKKYVVKLDEASRPNERIPLDPPIRMPENADPGQLPQFLASQIDKAAEYTDDTMLQEPGVQVMLQTHAGYPLFGIELRLYHRNSEIHAYQQQHAQDFSEVAGEQEQPSLSAAAALRRLLDAGVMPAGTVIRDIRFGLMYRPFEGPEGLAVPTWRVILGMPAQSADAGAEPKPGDKAESPKPSTAAADKRPAVDATAMHVYYVDAYHGEVSEARPSAEPVWTGS